MAGNEEKACETDIKDTTEEKMSRHTLLSSSQFGTIKSLVQLPTMLKCHGVLGQGTQITTALRMLELLPAAPLVFLMSWVKRRAQISSWYGNVHWWQIKYIIEEQTEYDPHHKSANVKVSSNEKEKLVRVPNNEAYVINVLP